MQKMYAARLGDIEKARWFRIKTIVLLWSKWRDSNPRPFGPEPNALPSCATPRYRPSSGLHRWMACMRANRGIRTLDLLITSELLYP